MEISPNVIQQESFKPELFTTRERDGPENVTPYTRRLPFISLWSYCDIFLSTASAVANTIRKHGNSVAGIQAHTQKSTLDSVLILF